MLINKENLNESFDKIAVVNAYNIDEIIHNKQVAREDIIYNDETIGILPYPIPENLRKTDLVNSIIDIHPNSLYIKSPFSHKYYELKNFVLNLPIEKFNAITLILGLIGAKKVDIKSFTVNESKIVYNVDHNTKTQINTKTALSNIDFKGYYSKNIFEKILSAIEMSVEFKGEKNIERAIKYAKKVNLIEDPLIKDFIEFSDIFKRKILNIDLIHEVQDKIKLNFSIESKVSAILFGTNIDIYANINKEISQITRAILTMDVLF